MSPAVEMPLYHASMCQDCFYDVGTFKFCCDTGRPHRPVLCPDCKVDTAESRPVSKFCTVSGKSHGDARNAEYPQSEVEAEACPFCGYEKTLHTFCTETSWKHAEISAKYAAFKKRPIQPAAKMLVKSNGVVPARPTSTTAAGNVLSTPEPKRVKMAAPAPAPLRAPTAPAVRPVQREAMYSDGSFLMSGLTPAMKILFVGEGNFSFSRTIGRRVFGDKPWRNMVATDLELLAGQDTPGHQFTAQNTIELLRKGGLVVTGVDATKISESLPFVQPGSFDLLTFQFPHNSEKNFPFYPYPKGLPLESVGQHREMLGDFLKQAGIMLKEGGRACITTKSSEPYKSWEVDMLAEAPMWFTKADTFDQAKWSQIGYTHINTVNKCSTSIDGALTYIFTKDSTGCTDYSHGQPIPSG
eukprot:TRINITY_DN15128_c0_g1_i4.p1 TRINITY_DN15128_c0_g1~~TRINITY_DN15128_c0_g1_i4.p1  ORF type:complete len:412 (+),score=114.30 TRINITY_DN15128_c0_g1_i4:153-1388(+)